MNTTSQQKLSSNPFANIDWSIVITYLALVIIGWVNIYAAVFDPDHSSIFDLSKNYGKQLLWILTSIVIIIFILIIDFKVYNFISYWSYIITILMLIAVLFIGQEVGGNKAWFVLGPLKIQPAEFAKLATCLTLAKYIGSNSLKLNKFVDQTKVFAIILAPLALIILQPDAGSALVFLSFFFMLYREGLPVYYLILGFGGAFLFVISLLFEPVYIIAIISIITATLIWISSVIKKYWFIAVGVAAISISIIIGVNYAFEKILLPHQQARIELLLGIREDTKGVGYNINQSKIAIGSGQLHGKGFLQGTQTKFDFVPEQSTDFIFCTIGEEWGFVGTTTVICIFCFLLLRIITIADRQRSTFARVYGYGVASILFMHIFINIGMTIGILPVIGIPLPFISYGGSSLWSFTILLFILVKLDTNKNSIIR